MKRYVLVWVALLAIVATEVVVTLARPSPLVLLVVLLVLASVEAGLALLYFMHLKYERRNLVLSLVPTLLIALLLMGHFFPDAFRLMHQHAAAP
jgi:cytochrome c oxidase subunit IV